VKSILLVILISRGDGSVVEFVSPHPTYQSCYAALEKARVQNSPGAENEQAVIAFCASDYAYVGSAANLTWRNK
jgi:hypothetical protein